MKINHLSDTSARPNITDAKPSKGSPASPATPGTRPADRMEASPLSSHLASIEAEIVSDPGFDQARVDSIKQAIRDGEFRINPEVIADKLIASVSEMINRKH